MSVTAAYNAKTGKATILKGRLHNGRPQRWTVTAKYRTPEGQRTTTIAPRVECTLLELVPLLEEQIMADAAEDGGVWGVEWIATSR